MSFPTAFHLHDAVKRGDGLEVIKLIHDGAGLDELDELGMAPLHWAVYAGDTEMVQILIDSGADVNIETWQGTTALWHAEDDFGLHEIAALLHGVGAKKLDGPPASATS